MPVVSVLQGEATAESTVIVPTIIKAVAQIQALAWGVYPIVKAASVKGPNDRDWNHDGITIIKDYTG